MMNYILWIALVLSLVVVLVQTQQSNNDFSVGELTEKSVLLRIEHIFAKGDPSGRVTEQMNYYTGTWAVIRKTEAFDLDVTDVRVYSGLTDTTLWLFFESLHGADINFMVHVYGEIAEPNHFELGELSERSMLAHSVQLRVPADPGQLMLGNALFHGYYISRIEVFDRNTNGTGAKLHFMFGGINSNFAQLTFISSGLNETIEIDVNFYVDQNYYLLIGSQFESTVFLGSHNANEGNNGIVSRLVHFQVDQPRRIGMIEAYSRSRINITDGGLYQDHITMNFTSLTPGVGVDYIVTAYSANVENVNDFRMGTFLPNDYLVHSERITVQAEIDQFISREVSVQIPFRIISMIQGFDMVTNGNGGYIATIAGGIGYRNVTLVLKSQFNQMIDFNIEIYGR